MLCSKLTTPPSSYPLSLHCALPIYDRGDLGALPYLDVLGQDGAEERPVGVPVAVAPKGGGVRAELGRDGAHFEDRKSTRLNSSHEAISYAVFCVNKKHEEYVTTRRC